MTYSLYAKLRSLLVFTTIAYGLAFALDYSVILPLYGQAHDMLIKRLVLLAALVARMWTPCLGVIAALGGRRGVQYVMQSIGAPRVSELILTAVLILGGYSLSLIIAVFLGLPLKPCIPGISLGLIVTLLAAGLVAGVTVNALVALGEEVAWRGFLLDTLSRRVGFWRSTIAIGTAWGLWHAPLVINGYNFSNDLLGWCGGREKGLVALAVFTLFTVAVGTLLSLLRRITGSVYVAAAGHGIVNAVGGLYALLVNGPRIIAPPAGISVSIGFTVTSLGLAVAQSVAGRLGARSLETEGSGYKPAT